MATTYEAENFTTPATNFMENASFTGPTGPAATSPPTSPGITHQNGALLESVEYPSLVAYYVFFVFCICLHILLLNLLIDLAVDDLNKITSDSEGRRLRKQVDF